ncbi:MAG: hypothetical protein ACK56I_19050, partial [bacterium]
SKLEDPGHLVLGLAVQARRLLLVAAQLRRPAQIPAQALHVELREGAPGRRDVKAVLLRCWAPSAPVLEMGDSLSREGSGEKVVSRRTSSPGLNRTSRRVGSH